MSAPESVVQAVMNEWQRRAQTQLRTSMEDHARALADAAFAASLEWVIEDIASTERAPLLSAQLRRRWARGDAS